MCNLIYTPNTLHTTHATHHTHMHTYKLTLIWHVVMLCGTFFDIIYQKTSLAIRQLAIRSFDFRLFDMLPTNVASAMYWWTIAGGQVGTDRHMDKWTYRWTQGRTDRKTDGWTDGWIDTLTNGQTDR